MRQLLIIGFIILGNIARVSAAVECEKVEGERGVRPKNELAKEIATKLGVKTCNGKRFRDVVKGLGETHNIPDAAATYDSVEDVVKSIKK